MKLTILELERIARGANPALAELLAQLLRDKSVVPTAVVRVPAALLKP